MSFNNESSANESAVVFKLTSTITDRPPPLSVSAAVSRQKLKNVCKQATIKHKTANIIYFQIIYKLKQTTKAPADLLNL